MNSPEKSGKIAASGNLGLRRKDAVVMFARLFAQCPGACLSTCISNEFTRKSIEFPEPPSGEVGCCGPVGKPGEAGRPGNPGKQGCPGDDGLQHISPFPVVTSETS